MSDDVTRYQVLISDLELLIQAIKEQDKIYSIKDKDLKDYQDKAITILDECLGDAALPHIAKIQKTTIVKLSLNQISEAVYLLAKPLIGVLNQIHGDLVRDLSLLEMRLKIREKISSSKMRIPSGPIKPVELTPMSTRIFIVHGHDEAMKQYVARTLTQLKLEPVILHEQPNKGRTIIEKFEEEAADVGFAVVLLSPDDDGRKAGDGDFHPRAR